MAEGNHVDIFQLQKVSEISTHKQAFVSKFAGSSQGVTHHGLFILKGLARLSEFRTLFG